MKVVHYAYKDKKSHKSTLGAEGGGLFHVSFI